MIPEETVWLWLFVPPATPQADEDCCWTQPTWHKTFKGIFVSWTNSGLDICFFFFGGISVQCIVAYNISQGSQVARDMKNPMRQQLWGKRKPRNPKSRSNPSFLTKPLGCCHKCSVKSQGGLHFCSFATLGLLPVPKEDKMEQIQGVSRRILIRHYSWALCHLLLVRFQSDVRKMWCVPFAVVLHVSNILAISGKRLCHPVQKKTRRMGQGRRHRCRILATIDSTQLCHLLLIQFLVWNFVVWQQKSQPPIALGSGSASWCSS